MIRSVKAKRLVKKRFLAKQHVGKLMDNLIGKVVRSVEGKLVGRAGLPLKLDAITKGDNNCFFNAVYALTQRPGMAQELAAGDVAGIRNPYDLRL